MCEDKECICKRCRYAPCTLCRENEYPEILIQCALLKGVRKCWRHKEVRTVKVGDIVRLKSNRSVMGEVKVLDDLDMATLVLLDGGTEVKVSMNDLIVEAGAINPHFEDRMVHILGVEYRIHFREDADYSKISTADGYMDHYDKRIVIGVFEYCLNSVRDLSSYTKKVMRHEIVHAFLFESGLWNNSHNSKGWASDEEITDWIAIQAPKLFEAFKEAGCI